MAQNPPPTTFDIEDIEESIVHIHACLFNHQKEIESTAKMLVKQVESGKEDRDSKFLQLAQSMAHQHIEESKKTRGLSTIDNKDSQVPIQILDMLTSSASQIDDWLQNESNRNERRDQSLRERESTVRKRINDKVTDAKAALDLSFEEHKRSIHS